MSRTQNLDQVCGYSQEIANERNALSQSALLWIVVVVCYSRAEGVDTGCHGNREASPETERFDAVIGCRPRLHVCWSDVERHLYRSVAFLPSSYLPPAFLNIPEFSPRWYHHDLSMPRWRCRISRTVHQPLQLHSSVHLNNWKFVLSMFMYGQVVQQLSSVGTNCMTLKCKITRIFNKMLMYYLKSGT